jgi:hypothetical protein
MSAPIVAIALLTACAALASASSQGLYTIEPFTGQLMLVNWTSALRTPIGGGIASLGWKVPADCTPTAVDTTGKWLYTFARRQDAPDSAPWSVLSLELRDGTIRKVYELPHAFPPALDACEHTLAEDGGWHAYVLAVTRDAAPRLIVYRFTYTWPASNESSLLLDAPLATLTAGQGPALAAAVTNFTAWVALSNGLLGIDLVTLAATRVLPVKQGSVLVGLQYSTFGAPRLTYGILVSSSSADTSIVSFADTGAGTPALSAAVVTGEPVAPDTANRVALLSDRKALSVVSAGELVTLDVQSGAVLGRLRACVDRACPVAIAYEPLVF